MVKSLYIGFKYLIDKYIVIIIPIIVAFIFLLHISSSNLEKFLIENIKSSLPEYYIYYYGNLAPPTKNIKHYKGGLDYSYSGFKIRINGENLLLNDIILNVFNERNITYVLRNYENIIKNKNDVIFFDMGTYINIGKPKYIEIPNKKGDYIKVKAIGLNLFLNKSLVLIPYYLAKEVIPLRYSSNIIIIKSNLDEDRLKKIYKDKYGAKVHTWRENIPFFFKYLYEITKFSIWILLISVGVFLGLSVYIIYEHISYFMSRFSKTFAMYSLSLMRNITYNIIILTVIFFYIFIVSTLLFKAGFFALNKFAPNIFVNSKDYILNYIYWGVFVFSVIVGSILIYKWRRHPFEE